MTARRQKKQIERPIHLDMTVEEAKTLKNLLLFSGGGRDTRWIEYRLDRALVQYHQYHAGCEAP